MTNPTDPETKTKDRKGLLWRYLPIATLAAGLVAFLTLGLHEYLTFETLKANRAELLDFVGRHLALATLIYVTCYAVSVAFSIPGGAVLTITGGFLFGLTTGTLATVIGATVGATGLFLAARLAFGEVLHKKAGKTIQKMEAGFRENAFNYLLVLRLIPLFPFWLVNLAPALLGVTLRTYVIATFIGIIPGTFVYTSIGNGLGAIFERGETPDLAIIFEPAILIPIVGLALLALLPIAYKKIKARKHNPAETEPSHDEPSHP
ncbi:MAG: TVP38/TMEM64 family protein [Alphaproteobacteria bacterium]|nr:TVP38/TMEM64 family protein [Alphaproteobacteria bacterium]